MLFELKYSFVPVILHIGLQVCDCIFPWIAQQQTTGFPYSWRNCMREEKAEVDVSEA